MQVVGLDWELNSTCDAYEVSLPLAVSLIVICWAMHGYQIYSRGQEAFLVFALLTFGVRTEDCIFLYLLVHVGWV